MTSHHPHHEHKKCFRFTLTGYGSYALGMRRQFKLFRVGPVLEDLAHKSWEIEPASVSWASRAHFLPGQLDRITGTAYTDDPAGDMLGGHEVRHHASGAIAVKNSWLINNSLFKGRWRFDLSSRSRLNAAQKFLPRVHVTTEIKTASIYSTYEGNEFFGLWLTDDCPAYSLAQKEGTPLALKPTYPHQPEYESLFGMNPLRTTSAFLKEAVFIDDNWSYGKGKHERVSALRNRILEKFPSTPHPGAFILRRDSGRSRVMANELEVAQYLQEKRGFKVVDATRNTASEILAACAGARVLAGIEGSQLANGLMALSPGAALLTLQPPSRFSSVLKKFTDMAGQNYAFVVGTPDARGFKVDPQEIERTLDLIPAF